jgi:hypothetical protein
MVWLLLFLFVAALVAAIVILRSRPILSKTGGYRSRKPLSEPEQVLFWRLREAVPECVVLSQVSFSRFIEPVGAHGGARQGLFNRISRKTVDFLVCLPDFSLVAAVELDDRTHLLAKDAMRDAILESAGIPMLRVNVRDLPTVEVLRAMFTK